MTTSLPALDLTRRTSSGFVRLTAADLGDSPFDPETSERLRMVLERLELDERVRGLVIELTAATSRPSAWYAPVMRARARADVLALHEPAAHVLQRIASSRKPVVFVLSNNVQGPWLDLALSGHARVSQGHLKLSWPESSFGLCLGLDGILRAVALVGLELAVDLAVFGRALDERIAVSTGLIDEAASPSSALHHASDAFGAAAHRAAQLGLRLLERRTGEPRLGLTNPARTIPGYARVALRDARTRARDWPGGENRAALRTLDGIEAFVLRGIDAARAIQRDAFAERCMSSAPRRALAIDEKIESRLEKTSFASAQRASSSAERAHVYLVGHGPDAIHTANALSSARMNVRLWDGRAPIERADLVIHAGNEEPHLLPALVQRAPSSSVVATTAGSSAIESPILALGSMPRLQARRVEELVAGTDRARRDSARAADLFHRHGRLAISTSTPVARRLSRAIDREVRCLMAEGMSRQQIETALAEWGFGGMPTSVRERRLLPRKLAIEEIQMRCGLAFVREAFLILGSNAVESREDLDLLAVHAAGFPAFRGGPITFADDIGRDETRKRMVFFARRLGARFEPPPNLV